MVGLVLQLVVTAVITILMSVGIFMIASAFHEGSHWIVGRIWSRDLEILRYYLIFPASVDFHSPYDLPPHGIRLAGVAPMLFGLPIALGIFLTLDGSFTGRILISLPFWTACILSPSDLLAILYPERFQDYAANRDPVGHFEMMKM